MATSARIDDLRKKFDENPRRYFAPLANEYRKAGDLAQAIAICRQHLADQPGHMSGHIVYGQALFENSEHDEAEKVFTAALALDPENLIALRLLGDIARDRAEYSAAGAWYQRVLDADPRNEDIQAQLRLVEDAATRAAAEAAAAPVADAAPVPTPARPTPSIADVKTVEIARVAPPWQARSSTEMTPSAPLPLLEAEDVVVPRLSLMGLDLESMAKVQDTSEQPIRPSTSTPVDGFETTDVFGGGKFDGELETESNPLDGVSGIETRDESSAASLLKRVPPPVDDAFEFTPPFGAPPANADLPPELLVPARNTPPVVDLGLPPQPRAQPTGLWDTLEEMEGEPAAVTNASANFEPPPMIFDAVGAAASTAPEPVMPDAAGFELLATPESPRLAGSATASEPFVTETMADLYVQQGHHAEALSTYQQLLAARPGDAGLTAKIAALGSTRSSASVGPLVRDFFSALARWTPGAAGGVTEVSLGTSSPSTNGGGPLATAADVPRPAAAAWMSERSFDLGVFAGAAIALADEAAAHRLAEMYPDALMERSSGAAVMRAPAAIELATGVESLPGNPARAASSELSLDQVFPDAAPARPSRKSASFSFDQFFSQTAQVAAVPRSPTPGAPVPAQPSAEEAEQFQSWLKGLKGP